MRPILTAITLTIGAVTCAARAQVPVRFPEGTVHGFLELRTDAGALLAHGDLIQTVTEKGVESRMVFHFADTATVFEETVRFTQDGAFAMQEYHLVQRGAVFPFSIDATLSRSGAYVVRTTSKAKDAKEKVYRGTLHLPADAANGLAIIYAKNVSRKEPTRVHLVAFTPEPRVIGLELEPRPSAATHVGGVAEPTVEFTLAPKLGALLRFFATLSGKAPPDSHAWITTAGAPAFVKFVGPLYLGATWQLTLAAPSPPGAE
jgi:hypothetical protein